MADTNTPITPAVAPGTDGGKKKIAGKFDSLEQAVEEGYVGLEKLVHGLAEGQAKLVKVIEGALATPTAPIGSSGYREDPYRREGRQQVDDDETVDPAKFLLNPGDFLQKRDERLATKIITSVVDLVGNMNAVNQFKTDNPDLVKHEKVVQAFMNDQPRNKSTAERLKGAGEAAREYLKSLKVDLNAGNPTRAPQGQEYVEAPAGGFRPGMTIPKEDDAEGEKDLLNYISERNADMASHFGSPPQKK